MGLATCSRSMRGLRRKPHASGVRLRISTDFDRLVVLNNSAPAIFNPKYYNDLGDGTAFFIEGVDDSGDSVVTGAGRLYDFDDRSLASELRSLRVYFAQPQPFCAGGYAEVAAPAAEHICGHAMFSGRRVGQARLPPAWLHADHSSSDAKLRPDAREPARILDAYQT
jgi:hypothetical protein